MSFKLQHWFREFLMNRIAQVRYCLRQGTKFEKYLERKNFELLEKQMELRRKVGKQEIQCHVIWGLSDD